MLFTKLYSFVKKEKHLETLIFMMREQTDRSFSFCCIPHGPCLLSLWASLLETLLCLFKLTEKFKTRPKKQHNIYRTSGWQMLSNACFASNITSVFKELGGGEWFRKDQPICLIFVFRFSLLISKPGFTLNLIKGLVWLIRITFDFDFARIEWRLVQRKFTV